MKAGVFEGIGKMVLREVPDPQLEKGSLIVKVRVCSICGTDLRIYRHGHRKITPPQVIGHEITGEIAQVDSGVADYKVGDRVAITPRVSCGNCFYCRKGQVIYCLSGRTFGFQLSGGFAEYVPVPDFAISFGVVHHLPDSLSFEQASLGEPLACCIRSQKALSVGPDDTVLVIGAGAVGIMHSRLAKANDAGRVILAEADASRLGMVDMSAVDEVIVATGQELQTRVEALTGGHGVDVVIVACSSAAAQQQSLSLAGRGGRIDFFGGLPPGSANISIESNLLHYKEIAVRGTHSCLPVDNREALDLLASDKISLGDLITHTFPLDSIAEAFRFAESKQGMHVAVFM